MEYAEEKLVSYGLDGVTTIEYPCEKNGTRELTF